MIKPNWQVSKKVSAFTTTRQGGVSKAPFDSFNLAMHVDDDKKSVLENRKILQKKLGIKQSPLWLDQRHTTNVVEWNGESLKTLPIADAAWTSKANTPVCVMTADCQPILVTNHNETFVASIHAGWQGLLDGIITKLIKQLPDVSENLIVWIGPSISQKNFEVEVDFVTKFVNKNPKNSTYFKQQSGTKYKADLVAIAELELQDLGIKNVYKSNMCTYANEEQFYSYRRENKTGRMVSVIYLNS